jgi:hypothetical protein
MANIFYSQTYTGQPVTVVEFTPSTRADWVNNMISALLAAGWTQISGSGTDRVLGSGTTPDNLKYKVRIWDPGSGNCARVGLRNWNETLLSDNNAAFCYPGGLTWKVVASAYQFFAWVPGSTAGRTFVMATAPKLEPAVNYNITEAAFFASNDQGDTSTASSATLRTNSYCTSRVGIILNATALFGGFVDLTRNLMLYTPAGTFGDFREWIDGSRDVLEARVRFHPSVSPKWLGYLWDAMLLYTSMSPDQTVTWDGRTWISLTANNTSDNSLGTVCLLVS